MLQFHVVDIMFADDLATPNAKTSAGIVPIQFVQNIQLPTQKGLMKLFP